MDDETRRAVDEACLRLLGHEDLRWSERDGGWWWVPTFGDQVHLPQSPSRQPAFVVPLAKALYTKGWHVSVRSAWLSDQWVAQLLHGGREITEYVDTMEGALALAAARAVSERQTNDKI